MRIVCLLLCILLLVGTLTGCAGNSIVGTWKHDTLGAAYEFTKDMQVIITLVGQNPRAGTYAYDNNTKNLVLTVDGQSQSGIVEVKGNTLRITSPDSGAVVTMTRVR